ncbi:hypothetical protein [Cellulomonas endophytica]|uniref:hypothetical protein n=1 Tax=Cellulomonas endophytica TaxID=2494735 RepID=UPI0010130539|nr:hypothetical protein [Cellulomonas endophytica]
MAGGTAGLLTTAARRDLPVTVTAPRDARPAQLVAGHCLEALPPDGTVEHVRLTPCEGPHAARVVSVYAFTDGWPGQAAADAAVARSCALSDAEVAAGARAVAWAPTERGWRLGERTGLCLVAGVRPAGP